MQDLTQSREYLVTCLGQYLALEVVPRSVLVVRSESGL